MGAIKNHAVQFVGPCITYCMKIQPKGSSALEVRRNEEESIVLCISNEKTKAFNVETQAAL